MRSLFKIIAFSLVLTGISLHGCRDPFLPDYDVEDRVPVLIVEGYINALDTQSTYTLGYTLPLGSSNDGNYPVTNALLSIEGENGERYEQSFVQSGTYVVNHPVLDRNVRYRLHIRIGTEEYLSEFVDVKISPEIEELEWEETPEGIIIYVSTADPNNDSRYYQWEFEEDWRFHALYQSQFIIDGNSVRYRNSDEQIYSCYLSNLSSDIHIATSQVLSSDVIYKYPVHFIPRLSEKLQSRYSIKVKQRVISREAFAYWDLLKENSENLGSIFGPMPTEIRGNIVNVNNPEAPVVGIVQAVGLAEKRLYIGYMEFATPWIVQNDFYNGCTIDSVPTNSIVEYMQTFPDKLIAYELYEREGSPFPTHYAAVPVRCADCAVRGRREPPAFWEE